MLEGVKNKKWRLLIKCPHITSTNQQTPLYLTLKCSDCIHPNYGKVELICKYEHNMLRRYTQVFEDLADNYTIEFFSLDELSANIYTYRHDFNENSGRFFTIDYLLFTVQIVQPLQRSDVPKSIKRVVEPTIISLSSSGNVQSKGPAHLLKSSKERRTASVGNNEIKQISSVLKTHKKVESPEQRNDSRENILGTEGDTQMPTWDPFSDESRVRIYFIKTKKN
jgi:hypothetical protein